MTLDDGSPGAERHPASASAHSRLLRARASYKSALSTTVTASAAPYGYTLTVWTTGAVLAHAHGIPDALDALFFLVGAVGAYALVASLAVRRLSEPLTAEPVRVALWGGLHVFSVGLAIGVAAGASRLVKDAWTWPLGGFLATSTYLLGSSVQLAFAHARTKGR